MLRIPIEELDPQIAEFLTAVEAGEEEMIFTGEDGLPILRAVRIEADRDGE